MILKCDAAQLEWRTKAYLAQDPVAIKEILNGEDLHTDNQKAFGLPSRLIAKIFIYRMIFADAFGPKGYNGPAYAYANDVEFSQTSTSVKYWEEVIERFFEKYAASKEHSLNLIREATTTGRIVNPSGRWYPFSPYQKWDETMDWPRTNIVNYPVQGLAADFMQLARLDIYKKYLEWQKKWPGKVLWINTVHDDVEKDVDNKPELIYNISMELIKSFREIPNLFERRYGVKVNVPMDGEVKFGWTLAEEQMTKFNPKTFEEDFNAVYNNHS